MSPLGYCDINMITSFKLSFIRHEAPKSKTNINLCLITTSTILLEKSNDWIWEEKKQYEPLTTLTVPKPTSSQGSAGQGLPTLRAAKKKHQPGDIVWITNLLRDEYGIVGTVLPRSASRSRLIKIKNQNTHHTYTRGWWNLELVQPAPLPNNPTTAPTRTRTTNSQ